MYPPLYISYYTIGNGYDAEATELVKTLDAFGLPHDVVGVPGFGSWQRATQYKAKFIAGMQRKHCGRPLVWLDADCRVVAAPVQFEGLRCDFAAHWLRNEEMLSGTLYFGPTPAAEALVRAWVARNAENPDGLHGDQRNLQDVVLASGPGLRTCLLPPEYVWIDGVAGDDISTWAYGKRDPVIRQLQASRRLRQ